MIYEEGHIPPKSLQSPAQPRAFAEWRAGNFADREEAVLSYRTFAHAA